ncbi:MAG TPA: heme A synthase [Gammaproteobacteria bacterium]|nr:heme A synthase [Gammaproteobacteria bacterium]|tara:strand:+ start:24 stop:1052 length:1029 start_codon:yes stop_codon:yes gene_type:complete
MMNLTQSSRFAVAGWLGICCVLVFCMVILGGVTRLTDSGLSMVRWEPISGILPPLNQMVWQAEFEHYRQFPEYQKINAGMSLQEFKRIFYFEYAHRMLGRIIGLVFAIGFVWLWIRKHLSRPLVPHLVAMFFLGGAQGLLGWYMVKSGLVDMPHVSQYRLTAHLGLAISIYLYILWMLFLLLERNPAPVASRGLRRASVGLGILAFLTVLSGGFVAGLKAGHAFNTFPLMAGQWIPPGYLALEPIWRNLFENIATVQFNHRLLAVSTLTLLLVFAIRVMRDKALQPLRRPTLALAGLATIQVGLGISTLLWFVPVTLGATHQAVALVLLSVMLYVVFRFRRV